MGMAAILVILPRPFEHTFIHPSSGGSTWNLASIGPVVSEKMFENKNSDATVIKFLYFGSGSDISC